jgi:hypothetical protein
MKLEEKWVDPPSGMKNETEQLFDLLFESIQPATYLNGPKGTVIPDNYNFKSTEIQARTGSWSSLIPEITRYIDFFPPGGGMIRLYPSGNWEGDLAPFCD